jgi:hypothetical protein
LFLWHAVTILRGVAQRCSFSMNGLAQAAETTKPGLIRASSLLNQGQTRHGDQFLYDAEPAVIVPARRVIAVKVPNGHQHPRLRGNYYPSPID